MISRTLLGGAVALAALTASPALAQKKGEPQLPTCPQPLGTVAVHEPESQWWRAYSLGSPEALIRVLVQKSGCFNMVSRGRALAMRTVEADMAAAGDLQRGSNVGRGQVRAADFYLVPDIVGADQNEGGNAIGAGLGGLVGGRVGGLLGGLRTKRLAAHTVLTLVNARTTEEVASAEGQAKKTDIDFGGGGFLGFVGAVGGGYADTEIGKIITTAYVNAYGDLVRQVQATLPVAAAPQRALTVLRPTPMMQAPGGKVMKQLSQGDVVYPTGETNGVFVKVADEFDIEGWVTTEAVRG